MSCTGIGSRDNAHLYTSLIIQHRPKSIALAWIETTAIFQGNLFEEKVIIYGDVPGVMHC